MKAQEVPHYLSPKVFSIIDNQWLQNPQNAISVVLGYFLTLCQITRTTLAHHRRMFRLSNESLGCPPLFLTKNNFPIIQSIATINNQGQQNPQKTDLAIFGYFLTVFKVTKACQAHHRDMFRVSNESLGCPTLFLIKNIFHNQQPRAIESSKDRLGYFWLLFNCF